MENKESCINCSTVLSSEPALKTAPVMTNQLLRTNEIHSKPSSSSTIENMSTSLLLLAWKSNRQLLSYTSSSGKKASFIVCSEKKYNKGREVEVKTI